GRRPRARHSGRADPGDPGPGRGGPRGARRAGARRAADLRRRRTHPPHPPHRLVRLALRLRRPRARPTVPHAGADPRACAGAGAPPAALHAQLLAVPGIGPWTAAYVAMRVLGDPDAWLTGDVALVAGARAAGVLEVDAPARAGHRVLAERAAGWAPWRSYAAM